MNEKETFYARYDAYPADCGYNYSAKWRGMYIYAENKHALDACIKEQKILVYGVLIGCGIVTISILVLLLIPAIRLCINSGNFILFYIELILALGAILFCLWGFCYCKKLHQEFEGQVIHLPIDA